MDNLPKWLGRKSGKSSNSMEKSDEFVDSTSGIIDYACLSRTFQCSLDEGWLLVGPQ